MSIFSYRVKELRKQNNFTQKEVADKLKSAGLDIGRTGYQAYESGRVKPSDESLTALSKVFNVSIDYLCGTEPAKGNDVVISVEKSHDIKVHLEYLLALLEHTDYKFNNSKMSDSMRTVLKSSIEQTLNTAEALNKVDKGTDKGK